MIKIEHTEVYGWEAAIRGMRNPVNSWHLSDSYNYFRKALDCAESGEEMDHSGYDPDCDWVIGEKDLLLMQNLSKSGNDHGKFLRMICVTADITAPLYWWKEYDTYKVGTVANSCSTMHKIHAKEFELDDFSHEHLYAVTDNIGIRWNCREILEKTIQHLNAARECYLRSNDKDVWWQMIQLLPSSYNQKRTVLLNYQVLKTMYHARKNHKLDEWHDFCDWCEGLPYFKEICILTKEGA